MTTKICSTCKVEKPLTDFYKDSGTKTGKSSRCSECTRQNTQRWHREHSGDPIHNLKKRNSHMKRRYGMNVAELETKLEEQGNRCGLCRIPLILGGHMAHVDHDHTTNQVRDILCTNCNRGLGHFQEDPLILQRAIHYLHYWKNIERDS